MPEDVSDQLSRVIALAVEEARELGHGYVGTEHLLIALARQRATSTASILAWHDLSPERLRSHVMGMARSEARRPSTELLPLTPAAKSLLELAGHAAGHLGADHVEPSHLLLAVLFDREHMAGRVLRECDADIAEIRSQLLADRSE
jgi:ATP-dependent Clp protease ATP-binding subunit ClpC